MLIVTIEKTEIPSAVCPFCLVFGDEFYAEF